MVEEAQTMPPTTVVEGKVGIYVCGVTPYDFSHIGHARAYVAFDVLYRYLQFLGYEVEYVRNFMDIDDKGPSLWQHVGLEEGVLGSGTPFIYILDPVGPWEHLSLLADCRGHLWEMPP